MMARLARDPAVAALALASAVRDAQTRREMLDAVLDACSRIAPFDNAVLDDGPRGLVLRDVDASAMKVISHCEANLERYIPDVELGLQVAARDGGFLDVEVYGRRRFELPMYREVVVPQDIECIIFLQPRSRGRTRPSNIRLQRGRGRPFSVEQKDRLLAMLPAVELAMHAFVDREVEDGEHNALAALGRREREVAELVARGLTTIEIARVLGTSPHTVQSQLRSIFRKAHVSTRAELAALVASARGAPSARL